MHLTERDLRILRLIRDQRFVTAEQLKHEYPGARMSEVYRRLGELERCGLLKSERLLTRNQKLYIVTREYHGDGHTKEYGYLPYFGKPRVHQIEHDLKVTNVRLVLQSLYPTWCWTPERAILAERDNLPTHEVSPQPVSDGMLEGWSGEVIYIEVENSNKSEVRTRKTMQRWMDDRKASLVLYVATKEEVYRQLIRVLRSLSVHGDHDPVGIIRYDDLIKAMPPVFFETYRGRRFLKTEQELNEGVETNASPSQSI